MEIRSADTRRDQKWLGKRPGLFVYNSRFYILCFSVLLSITVLCYFRTEIISDKLYMIRTQQVYGFLALLGWYLALLATPLSTIFGKNGFMGQYLYARRAFGVSAAYFALLHTLLSLFGQLGGLSNLAVLPGRFWRALVLGFIGLIFLSLMAVTSFDKVIAWMTFPRWKWLHRLGYIGGVLVLLHVWMIGTHLTYPWVRWTSFILLIVLSSLESWRIAAILKRKVPGLSWLEQLVIFITIGVVFGAAIAYIPSLSPSFHEEHTASGGEH